MTSDQQTGQPRSKSRRKFLVRTGLGTIGVLALGTYVFRNPLRRAVLGMSETLIVPYSGTGTKANLWFEITTENTVILYSPKVEMGQGTHTGFAQIAADELDVDLDQIIVRTAESSTGVVDGLSTGGSLSVAQLWQPLREMAATMREMVKTSAAAKLGVPITDLLTSGGVVTAGATSMTYAEAVAGITEWDLPDTPELRPVSSYQFVGKPVPRVDLEAKVMGDPVYGLDAEMPGMLFATVVRPEHIGSTMKSVDTSVAESMPGVVRVVKRDQWVGIVGESYAQVLAAKRYVTVEWEIPRMWTEEDLRDYLKVGEGNLMVTQKTGSGLSDDDTEVEMLEFTSPIGAHAQIEPNGAVAEVKDGKATVILSTQVIGITQKQVADALGFDPENVNIVGTYLGGGFGGRLNTAHAALAAQMSQEAGRPVKYVFTRKEEFQNDTFRPPTHHIVKGKLNDGRLEQLEHHYASGDVAINSVIFPPIMHKVLGTDVGAMRGGNIMYDKIPNRRAEQWHKPLPFATSWWRSLGLLANTFAIESFIDEMALKSGRNAVDFRLAMLGDHGESPRIKTVIETAAAKAGYTEQVTGNRAMGIAASIDAGSPCCQVVEVEVKDDGSINVEKVVCAFDCGLAVNPDQVVAQCEGAIIMGISAVLHEKMTIQDGRLYPINYGAYEMALMRHSPRIIDVHLIKGADVPLPVGEPPLGPIGAAIGNAVRRITGRRLTDLPMQIV